MTYSEILERLETATGPDREIDGLVCAVVFGDEPYIIGHEGGRFPQKAVYGTKRQAFEMTPTAAGADYICAPFYTASLDAVVALIESELPGWWRRVECSPRPSGAGEARAKIWRPEEFFYPGSEPVTFEEDAKTEPLALLAAAIRALADKEANNG